MANTWADLINEVRAQIAVSPDQAWVWLLDRARVMNAEARWLYTQDHATISSIADGRYWNLPTDLIWLEAVIVAGVPYQRSTPKALDARWAGDTGNTSGIYALGQGLSLQLHPGHIVDPLVASDVQIHCVLDVEDTGQLGMPPFPNDFDQALVDGAVAMGLARMDERFDSASYFDAKFAAAIERLKRRRHGMVGRGATQIRVVQ